MYDLKAKFKGLLDIVKFALCIYNSPSLWLLYLVSNQTFEIKIIFYMKNKVTLFSQEPESFLIFTWPFHLTKPLAWTSKVIFLVNKTNMKPWLLKMVRVSSLEKMGALVRHNAINGTSTQIISLYKWPHKFCASWKYRNPWNFS